jgi:hypothetical protein
MNRRTRGLAAGVATLGAGAILIGPIQTDEPDDPTSTTPSTAPSTDPDATADEPASSDVDPGRDVSGWLEEALAPLVEDGTLTQAQVDAVVETLEAARPVFDGDRGRRGHWGGPGLVAGRHSLDTAAEAIGISEDDLRAALEDGQTLAEIAEAHGVDAQAVIDALVGEATDRLDEAVADGRLDETEAEERRAEITERITEMVNEGALPGRIQLDELPHPRGPWDGRPEAGTTDSDDGVEDAPSTTIPE